MSTLAFRPLLRLLLLRLVPQGPKAKRTMDHTDPSIRLKESLLLQLPLPTLPGPNLSPSLRAGANPSLRAGTNPKLSPGANLKQLPLSLLPTPAGTNPRPRAGANPNNGDSLPVVAFLTPLR